MTSFTRGVCTEASEWYEPCAETVRTWIERVPSDKNIPRHLQRWKEMRDDWWSVTVVRDHSNDTVVCMACKTEIRQCAHCAEVVGVDHDPCIANLPGVMFACCGHGVLEGRDRITTCYVVFVDGPTLYGRSARAAMQMLGGDPPPIPDEAPHDGGGVGIPYGVVMP